MSKVLHSADLFSRLVKITPYCLLALLTIPVLGGLMGVMLPAFGWAPALNKTNMSLAGFNVLWDTPGLSQMIGLSIRTGLISTLIAFALMIIMLAAFFNSVWLKRIEYVLSPILVIPHAAAAIAVSFLIAPSGLFTRLFSPWLTGWQLAPEGSLPYDAFGWSIIIGLVLKELPFLLLIALGILAQPELGKKLRMQHQIAINLGYYPMVAFFKVVLPNLYPLLRLPIFAVLAYASASVEMPLILGPNTPPTLAVAIMHWFNDVDLTLRIKASAGALLQLAITVGLLLIWLLLEKISAMIFSQSLINGRRHYAHQLVRAFTYIVTCVILVFIAAALIGLVLWSVAGYWRFPDTLPSSLVLLHFENAFTHIHTPLFNTLVVGVVSSGFATILVLLCLEAEQITAKPLAKWALLIIYLPLLVPSIAFLFGIVWLQQLLNSQHAFFNVIFVHLLFVLPYVFLSIADSYRRLDPRLARVAASLGSSPWKVFIQVKLPQLFAPILIAMALGLAISFGQYLSTQLAGGGRIATITTEAVTLANGASRRTSAVYAILQMGLPLLGFILAWGLPRYVFNNKQA
ncbi:ABC transporter permease subunit [Pseudoalteromonas sp. SIMBA_153]